MDWLDASDYWLSRLVFLRVLGLIYLVAFLAAANQFRALLGDRGILPISTFVRRVAFRRSPSIFYLHYSDRLFAVVAWSGVVLSGAVVVGLADQVPLWTSMLIWVALWALYLSIINVGQRWYGFGWETLLVEAGLLAVFLGAGEVEPPILVLLLLRWLLFRVEFGAGMIKIRGDQCWRDLTCLRYHHETQPMPGPLSWWFHHLPMPLHKVEVAANHVAQLVVPFLLFTPQPVAGIAAVVIIVTQGWLMLSGNFSWLNAVTIAIAIPALGDGILDAVVPVSPPATLEQPPGWHQVLVVGFAVVVVVLSYRPARNLLSRDQMMNTSFEPLRLVNTYGAFGSITRVRREVVIEGTDENELTAGTAWREYGFKGKPGDPSRRPPQVAPYHLRLDWLMWFAALSPSYAYEWFAPLMTRLLENDRATLKLLRHNPFPDAPPTFVRALFYEYRFTSWRERRATGNWWHRELLGEYASPISLDRGEVGVSWRASGGRGRRARRGLRR